LKDFFKEAEDLLTNLLAPHITPKNLFKISQSFGCIADSLFLERVFQDESMEEDMEKLVTAMEYYSQFHE